MNSLQQEHICVKCGRKCKSQMEEDAKLCEHHLEIMITNKFNDAVSGESIK